MAEEKLCLNPSTTLPQTLNTYSTEKGNTKERLKQMPIDDFRGISLRKDLVDEVEKFIESFGRYKSVTDFVTEATRLRLEELQKQYCATKEV